jgi:ATP-dependent DNA helicase RecQ
LIKEPSPTIIYASTRKAVEQIAGEFDFIPYHAGMTDEARHEAQNKFMNDSCPVLVATNAFGMGIDRPDVRRVIYYNMPGSLEAYYQEAGRAGRDGETAECVLLFSFSDRYVHEFLIELSNPPETLIRELYSALKKVAAESENGRVELSHKELADYVPEAKEGQIGSALQILDKNGYINRDFNQSSEGELRFTDNLKYLKEAHSLQKTQRSRFIFRCISHFGAELLNPVKCSYGQLCSIANLNPEQIKRVLRALEGDCIEWKPPFSGRAIELSSDDDGLEKIDFESLQNKRDFEMDRLEEVISYTKSKSCRQAFLISYFGEKVNKWTCKNCDRCNGGSPHNIKREATTDERRIIASILTAVRDFDGRFGHGKISLVLAGAKRPEIVNWGLDRSTHFGKLKDLSQNNIQMFMKSLEKSGHLEKVGNPKYPCLGLSFLGEDALYSSEEIVLDFPEVKLKSSGRSKTAKAGSAVKAVDADDLLGRLRFLRKEIAAERNIPVFQVLTNAAIEGLAESTPVTAQEALKIKGIGPAKAKTVVPRFLSEIKNWREGIA